MPIPSARTSIKVDNISIGFLSPSVSRRLYPLQQPFYLARRDTNINSGGKFEDMFLVKIASKRTFLNGKKA